MPTEFSNILRAFSSIFAKFHSMKLRKASHTVYFGSVPHRLRDEIPPEDSDQGGKPMAPAYVSAASQVQSGHRVYRDRDRTGSRAPAYGDSAEVCSKSGSKPD